MIDVKEIYQMCNDLLNLPDEKVRNITIYPLPYDGYFEIFVETDKQGRYRALATEDNTLSNFVKVEFPQNTPRVG